VPGGIDFRSLPIITQPMPGIAGGLPQKDISALQLDPQWQEIQRMLASGIIPSGERLKECLKSHCTKEDMQPEINNILSCIADIFRLEEDKATSTDPALRKFLVLLESGKSSQELKQGLNQISFAPQEPELVE